MVSQKKIYYSHDSVFLIAVLLLIGIGLIAVFSASSILAEQRYGDHYYYLKRQGVFCLFGLLLMILAKNINYLIYRRLVYFFLGLSLFLLILLFVPGLGVKVAGAQRWLRFGVISVQPSEAAKLSLAIFVAYSMSKNVENMGTLLHGLLPHLLMASIFMILILLQPDLGTAIIIGMWMLILLFIGGVNLGQLVVLLGLLTTDRFLPDIPHRLQAPPVVGIFKPMAGSPRIWFSDNPLFFGLWFGWTFWSGAWE